MTLLSYEALKALAREKREQHGLVTAKLNLAAIRKVYRAEGVQIDLRELSPRIRALYMCADDDPSVLVNSTLPKEPRLFAMAHELKHHYCDREIIESGEIRCGDYNANKEIEIGAEVFAAELIFPESEFLDAARTLGLKRGAVQPEDVVRLKRQCSAPVSYTFLRKRFERAGLIDKGAFDKVKFTLVEESLYGTPIYKQPWFKARRAVAKRR
jgi:Zn-dependent peptidase ImmA (M78 family)